MMAHNNVKDSDAKRKKASIMALFHTINQKKGELKTTTSTDEQKVLREEIEDLSKKYLEGKAEFEGKSKYY
jgi:hypothetical protein